jgi:hypothetical protein
MESNINRSPSSYRLNPQSERDKYADQGDTDKTMLLLKFMSDKKKPLGALNWFAVHGTSLNSTNLVRRHDVRVGLSVTFTSFSSFLTLVYLIAYFRR